MRQLLTGRVYPVMLTPFTPDLKVDYPALDELVDWYLENGCDGLFAVCQSSEMHFLTLEERQKITEAVVRRAAGKVSVVSSGHISDGLKDQLAELKAVACAGADSVVLVTNRLAAEGEPESVVRDNIQRILDSIPDTDFGLYECPHPYKRLFSPEILSWCAGTGRFTFFKETSCRMESIRPKIEAVRGSRLRFYNANTETLLSSLREGCDGFSGVMANIHPRLYAWLLDHFQAQPDKADELQIYLTRVNKEVEGVYYPLNAKYLLKELGLPMLVNTRNPVKKKPTVEVEALMERIIKDDQRMLEYLAK